jgi:hypothetical protein
MPVSRTDRMSMFLKYAWQTAAGARMQGLAVGAINYSQRPRIGVLFGDA